MTPRWLVAKYMPDLRRREPHNVGVILFTDAGPVSRFLGETATGSIDGRQLPQWVGSTENYKWWINYWRSISTRGYEKAVASFAKQANAGNYEVEEGGQIVAGASPSNPIEFLDSLFATLVWAKPPAEEEEEPTDVHSLLEEAGIVASPFDLQVELSGGTFDVLHFDYRYDNRQIHLMRRVKMMKTPNPAWNAVHAAAYVFRAARTVKIDGGRPINAIALVSGPPQEQWPLAQRRVLETEAAVIDTSKRAEASQRLRSMMVH